MPGSPPMLQNEIGCWKKSYRLGSLFLPHMVLMNHLEQARRRDKNSSHPQLLARWLFFWLDLHGLGLGIGKGALGGLRVAWGKLERI